MTSSLDRPSLPRSTRSIRLSCSLIIEETDDLEANYEVVCQAGDLQDIAGLLTAVEQLKQVQTSLNNALDTLQDINGGL